jgi:hypothetical protein
MYQYQYDFRFVILYTKIRLYEVIKVAETKIRLSVVFTRQWLQYKHVNKTAIPANRYELNMFDIIFFPLYKIHLINARDQKVHRSVGGEEGGGEIELWRPGESYKSYKLYFCAYHIKYCMK